MLKTSAALAFLALAALGGTAQAQSTPQAVACETMTSTDKMFTIERTTTGDRKECPGAKIVKVVDTYLGVVCSPNCIAVAPTPPEADINIKNCVGIETKMPEKFSDLKSLSGIGVVISLWSNKSDCGSAPFSRLPHRNVTLSMGIDFSVTSAICYLPGDNQVCIERSKLTEQGQSNLVDFIGPADLERIMGDLMKGKRQPI